MTSGNNNLWHTPSDGRPTSAAVIVVSHVLVPGAAALLLPA